MCASKPGNSPISVHTVGVLAVTLGLADLYWTFTVINFGAQAAELVHVASLPCRRKGRSRHFLQKNTMVSAHFASQPRKCSRWLQGCPRCLQSLVQDFSLRGFLLQDSSSRIRPLGFLNVHSSSRIPLPGFLLQDSSSKIPPPGFIL